MEQFLTTYNYLITPDGNHSHEDVIEEASVCLLLLRTTQGSLLVPLFMSLERQGWESNWQSPA